MSVSGIEIPCKVNRPKVNSALKEEQAYPDVDEGLFLHERPGKTIFQPRNWSSIVRSDLIKYNVDKHKKC